MKTEFATFFLVINELEVLLYDHESTNSKTVRLSCKQIKLIRALKTQTAIPDLL